MERSLLAKMINLYSVYDDFQSIDEHIILQLALRNRFIYRGLDKEKESLLKTKQNCLRSRNSQ